MFVQIISVSSSKSAEEENHRVPILSAFLGGLNEEEQAHQPARCAFRAPIRSTTDMRHYPKPTLNKEPQRIILHVGTNDLQGKPEVKPNHMAESIVDLARMVEKESDAEVKKSEIVTKI